MNLFLTVVMTNEILSYMSGKSKLKSLIIVILSTLYIATISELKVYYIEFIMIIVISILTSNPSRKTIIIVAFSVIALVAGIQLLYNIYPEFADFFDEDNIKSYTSDSGYSNKDNLNRATAILDINEMFFNSTTKKIFGIGMGSAEVSQYDFLCSDFYKTYSYLAYNWFSHSFMVLENGFLGFGIYILFFVSIIIRGFMTKKKDITYMSRFGIILSIMAILNMFYNASLRNEPAYIFYLAIACVFINEKKTITNSEGDRLK